MAGIAPWHGDLRRGKDILSRPIIGHTPRKLPAGPQSPASSQCSPGLCPARALIIYRISGGLSRVFCVFQKFFAFAGFPPAGPAHQADGLRAASRRAGGGAFQRMVPLNFSLSAFQAGRAPQAYFSLAGKVGKRAPNRPRPPSLGLRPIHLAHGFGILCPIGFYEAWIVRCH